MLTERRNCRSAAGASFGATNNKHGSPVRRGKENEDV